MADSNLEILSLQIRRIVEAVDNLIAGIAHAQAFRTEHDLAAALDDSKALPDGYAATDYAILDALCADLKSIETQYADALAKFKTFDAEGKIDALGILGKKFYVFGG